MGVIGNERVTARGMHDVNAKKEPKESLPKTTSFSYPLSRSAGMIICINLVSGNEVSSMRCDPLSSMIFNCSKRARDSL